jgi:hypothetical protein
MNYLEKVVEYLSNYEGEGGSDKSSEEGVIGEGR